MSTQALFRVFCMLVIFGCFFVIMLLRFSNLQTFEIIPQTATIQQLNVSNTDRLYGYSEAMYIQQMIKWSISPNSFCFENYFYILNGMDSSIVILSISNLNELNRNLIITNKFIFYLRISRILYANKYKYKYCEFQETFDISKPPHWSKWSAIRMISTLNNIKHIIWIDIDAIFHSKTTSFENSAFYKNNYDKNKLFVFNKALDGNHINAGIFMVNINNNNNTKEWNVLDILDLFSYVVISKKIKTYTPPYEQHVFTPFMKEYKKEYDRYCIMLGNEHKIQLHGFKKPNYEYFIWHWTGIDQRYQKMIATIKTEIKLFLKQKTFKQMMYINISQIITNYELKNEYQLNQIIKLKKHIFEPKWVKQQLICESAWWKEQKTMSILGHIPNKQDRQNLCHVDW